MAYTVGFGALFAKEYANFQPDQQRAVTSFIVTFQANGLGDFGKYTGKIGPSWKGAVEPQYSFAFTNDLWHYHVGLPLYTLSPGGYQTSEWLLHFQWRNYGNSVTLLDLYKHYRADGTFYMPGQPYLEPRGD